MVNNEILSKKLHQFVRTKFEPYSNVSLDHLIKLEKEIMGIREDSPEKAALFSFTELLNENKFQFEDLGLTMNLLVSRSDNVLNNNYNSDFFSSRGKKRGYVMEQIRQLLMGCFKDGRECYDVDDNGVDAEREKKLGYLEKVICSHYSVDCFEDLGIG